MAKINYYKFDLVYALLILILLTSFPATIISDGSTEKSSDLGIIWQKGAHGETLDAFGNLLKNYADDSGTIYQKVRELGGRGAAVKDMERVYENGGDLKKALNVVEVARHGIQVNVRYIDDGAKFVSDLGGTGLSKGELGERATHWVIKKKGKAPLGETDGFFKNLADQEGIDLIYKDGDAFVIVESKFTSSSGNVGKGILSDTATGKQMSDAWIGDAIDRMKRDGLISPQLADDLLDAKATGKIRKELVVVQNVPIDGKTVVDSLTETGLNIRNVELIKIGEVVP